MIKNQQRPTTTTKTTNSPSYNRPQIGGKQRNTAVGPEHRLHQPLLEARVRPRPRARTHPRRRPLRTRPRRRPRTRRQRRRVGKQLLVEATGLCARGLAGELQA